MGYPFATWGEMCFMSVQCGIQVGLFYKFTSQGRASEFSAAKGLGFLAFVGVMLSYAAAPAAVAGGLVRMRIIQLGGRAYGGGEDDENYITEVSVLFAASETLFNTLDFYFLFEFDIDASRTTKI